MENKQLFFSHTWIRDNLNRDNHKRVYELAKKLRLFGWSIWIDEENLIGNIDAGMALGIDNADAIIVCLTETYFKKVNETANNPRLRDNCLKEWTYANARNKLMIPVIMESVLLDINNWPPGIISLHFGSTLYVDGTNDNLYDTAICIHRLLLQFGLHPKIFNTKKKENIRDIIKKVNTILSVDATLKKTQDNLSKKNLLKYLPFNKKVCSLGKYDIRRNSDTQVLKESSNRLYKMHKKWRSTGQLTSISI